MAQQDTAWREMFANLQTSYAELTHTEYELERRAAELEAEVNRSQQVFESMSEGLFFISRTGRVELANRAAGELLGRDVEELVGKRFQEVFDSAEIPATPRAIKEYLRSGKTPKALDVEIPRRNGRPLSVIIDCDLVRDKRSAVTGVLIVVRDVSERKLAEEALRESEKTRLEEINHRVANNLAKIVSMLNLQSRNVTNPESIELINECKQRIQSIAIIHRRLYQSQDRVRLCFGEYVKELIGNLFHAYGVSEGDIVPKIEIRDIFFDSQTATRCGLIINELVTNSLKHAFPPGRQGEIRIELYSDGDNAFTLTVSDNGVGIPEDVDIHNTTSLESYFVGSMRRARIIYAAVGSPW